MFARELCIFGRSVSSRRTRSSQNVEVIPTDRREASKKRSKSRIDYSGRLQR